MKELQISTVQTIFPITLQENPDSARCELPSVNGSPDVCEPIADAMQVEETETDTQQAPYTAKSHRPGVTAKPLDQHNAQDSNALMPAIQAESAHRSSNDAPTSQDAKWDDTSPASDVLTSKASVADALQQPIQEAGVAEPDTQDVSRTSVLFIDLENCPGQMGQIQEHLDTFHQVVICYANSGVKIPIDWLVPLSKTIQDNRLRIFKVSHSGKNAADFGIAFMAGRLLEQLPQDAYFVIISNDSDLNHVVSLLKSEGRHAKRIGKDNLSATSKTIDDDRDLLGMCCKHLMSFNKNRPASIKALTNSLMSKLQICANDGNALVEHLLLLDIISTDEHGKLKYNERNINKFQAQ